ncbi:uncharacterized protein EV420DRAFT_1529096 [Desarmillaria tabescens]|uniref:Uncharacterized protein n=1 Tax=Armillaria tabescens TaxID=1929756 RepID=A0AA39N8D0_ARMTA|nr:uncharacterized protein EV420DRAFT_1529096 [Desarmillaria tabescens]KAK0460907.1 hypothetical protein EV420DRAFT_1529096 [Desarmillaria tabescens]
MDSRAPISFSAVRRRGAAQPRPVKDAPRTGLKALKTFFEDNVFLFCQSPEEVAKFRLKVRNQEWKARQLYETLPHTNLPSNEYVQVEFYSQMNMLYQQMEPDIDMMFRLDEFGGLDLRALRRNWGLQTCVPIHPLRWELEDPADRDWLSPLAVANLCERGLTIKFTEPFVSKFTIRQRQLRASYRAFRAFSDLFLCYFISRLDRYTPLVNWYRAFQRIPAKRLKEIETTVLGFFVVLAIGSVFYNHHLDLWALAVWLKEIILCLFYVH